MAALENKDDTKSDNILRCDHVASRFGVTVSSLQDGTQAANTLFQLRFDCESGHRPVYSELNLRQLNNFLEQLESAKRQLDKAS